MLRWQGQINVWESLYIFPASLGIGLLNSSQFIGLSASVEKSQLATTISIFFLSQQIGMMIGASASSALLRKTFRNALLDKLGNGRDSRQVSILGSPNILSPRSPRGYLSIVFRQNHTESIQYPR